MSVPNPSLSTSAPVDIPRRGSMEAPRAPPAADYRPLLRRHSLQLGGGSAAFGASFGGAAEAHPRAAELVRSLSKGLSESLRFD